MPNHSDTAKFDRQQTRSINRTHKYQDPPYMQRCYVIKTDSRR